MYSPCWVLPYHRSLLQWYTFVELFTQTLPAPPAPASARDRASPDAADPPAAAGAFEGIAADLSFAYQSFTPPWPEQAPLLLSAEVNEPSWHSPVEPFGASAFASVFASDFAVGLAAGALSFAY